MTTKTASEVLSEIHEAATTASANVRRTERHIPGQVSHQGDVYVHMVGEEHPHGKEIGTRQVAVGDTQGSRHIAEGEVEVFAGQHLPAGFKAPAWLNGVDPKEIFLGPLVVAKSRWTLTHPEHAHHSMPPGRYQVTFQADARARARVAD